LVPGVISDEFGLIVGPKDERTMARTDALVGNGAQHARSGLIAGVGVGAENRFGDAIIHAVTFRFPASAAEKTIVAPVVLANERPFESVPVPGLSIHRPRRLESLPVRARAQHGAAFLREFRHGVQPRDRQAGACARLGTGVEKIPREKKVPLAVV